MSDTRRGEPSGLAARPRVLVTGFGAFPGAPANPSRLLARKLLQLRLPALAGIDRHLLILPTRWSLAAAFPGRLDAIDPDIVLMLGLAARRRQVCIETLGRNATRMAPDAAGRRPAGRRLDPAAAPVRRMAGPPMPLLAALRAGGAPARLSRDAGGYVCNALAFRAYGWAHRHGRLAVFVHVPRPRRGGALGRPRMERALGRMLVACMAARRRMLITC